MSNSPFRICLTMAGAVSAGAYTAGVLDYLLETLHLWETYKGKGNPEIPEHDVVIEVASGASAGGIASTVMLLALLEGDRSKLKKAWVTMGDDDQHSTLFKLLSCDDLIDQKDKVRSLLNSNPFDEIADDLLNLNQIQNDCLNREPKMMTIIYHIHLIIILMQLQE